MSRDSDLRSLKKDLDAIDLSEVSETVPCISTGVAAFDLAMSGGWPEGRFSEIYGEWQTGKSQIMYQSIAACQRAGGIAILDDSERVLTPSWARKNGINLDDLIYYTAPSLEEGFTHLEKVAKLVRESDTFKNQPVLYVKDSLAASVTKEELDRPFDKPGVALRARAIAVAVSRLTNLIADQRIAVVFVNQLRTNVGVMFGDNEETTGGKSPKYYASMRIALRRGKKLKEDDKMVGIIGKLEVVKSRIGIPFRKVEFELTLGHKIAELSGLLDYLVDQDVISRPTTQSYEFSGNRFRATDFPTFWAEKKEEILQVVRRREIDVDADVVTAEVVAPSMSNDNGAEETPEEGRVDGRGRRGKKIKA